MINVGDTVKVIDRSGMAKLVNNQPSSNYPNWTQDTIRKYKVIATGIPWLPVSKYSVANNTNDTILQEHNGALFFTRAEYCIKFKESQPKKEKENLMTDQDLVKLQEIVKNEIKHAFDKRERKKVGSLVYENLAFDFTPERHGDRWTQTEDNTLRVAFQSWCKRQCRVHQRTSDAIRERVRYLLKRCLVD